MTYSKKEIGEELNRELDKGYSVERISNWADDLFFSIRHKDKDSAEIEDILTNICVMEAGPEFVYTEKELRFLAEKLINNEDEPIKDIKKMKTKRWSI